MPPDEMTEEQRYRFAERLAIDVDYLCTPSRSQERVAREAAMQFTDEEESFDVKSQAALERIQKKFDSQKREWRPHRRFTR